MSYKKFFRNTYGTGYDWYNRIGNGIRDPNGTDFVYVFVGETATCVNKSQGVHNKCLKKSITSILNCDYML